MAGDCHIWALHPDLLSRRHILCAGHLAGLSGHCAGLLAESGCTGHQLPGWVVGCHTARHTITSGYDARSRQPSFTGMAMMVMVMMNLMAKNILVVEPTYHF